MRRGVDARASFCSFVRRCSANYNYLAFQRCVLEGGRAGLFYADKETDILPASASTSEPIVEKVKEKVKEREEFLPSGPAVHSRPWFARVFEGESGQQA